MKKIESNKERIEKKRKTWDIFNKIPEESLNRKYNKRAKLC